MGLEGRLSFVQMLLNHLLERDRQKSLNIYPWVLTERAYNSSSDDPQHFMSSKQQITNNKQNILETAEFSFCDSCIWSVQISCADSVEFMQEKYNFDEIVSIIGVIENAA